jgi:hypothetical protein
MTRLAWLGTMIVRAQGLPRRLVPDRRCGCPVQTIVVLAGLGEDLVAGCVDVFLRLGGQVHRRHQLQHFGQRLGEVVRGATWERF